MALGNNPIERIQVILQATTKRFEASFDRAKLKMQMLQKQSKNFGNVMAQPQKQFQKFVNTGKNASTMGGRLATRVRHLTHGMKGFRMEMLGVMFFGMMLKNMFTQLFNPVMEAFGVFELFKEMLLIVFLPVMEMLFPIFLKVMDWLINLPDPVKKIIGIFALLGVGLGIVLFIIGSFALGIGSLILVFGGLFGIISKLIPDVSVLGVNISSFVEAGLGIGLVALAFEKVKEWLVKIKDKFMKLDFVKELIEKIKTELEMDPAFTKIKDWVEKIKTKFNTFWEEFKKKLEESGINDLGDTMKKIGSFADEAIPELKKLAKGLTSIADILETSYDWAKKVRDALKTYSSTIQKFLGVSFGKSVSEKIWGINQKEDDFIWRSGQGAVGINPNDNIVGFKGDPPNLGGGSGQVNYSPTFNINVVDKYELEKMLDNNNKQTVDELRRMIKT